VDDNLFQSTATIRAGVTVWKITLLGKNLFQAEVQFAAAMPRKRWLDGYLWLRRQATHPRIRKIEMGIFRDYGHIFRLTRHDDLDEDLIELLHEAYIIGCEI